MNKSLRHINVETSNGTSEVDYLHKWVGLVANVVCNSFDHSHKSLTTDLSSYSFKKVWQCFPEESFHFGHIARAILIHTDKNIEEGHRQKRKYVPSL